MVKSNELREGNLIADDLGRIVKVESIFYDRFNLEFVDGQLYSSPLSEHSPIPLTPEILEKAGFEESHFFEGVHSGVYNKNGLKIGLDGDDLVKAQYTAIFGGDIFVKVQYLHQLQNLYFALTGEELTINL